MEITLERITLEEKNSLLKATAAELNLSLDLADLVSDVEYQVRHHRVDNEVFLDGLVSFTLKFTCARCLEEYHRQFSVPLRLVLQLVADEAVETFEETDDEFIIYPLSREVYNLDRHLRELVGLEVPMKPLCREDCAGLCPECGTNLNESSCSCREKEIDTRWQGLKRLLNDN
jgi:uncharacterized protein